MIKCRNLTKQFSGATAVNGVNLDIDEGELVGIIGPSGAGKTTLLHLFGGLISPDSGTLTIKGRSLASYDPGRELSRLVGVMHQQFDLVDQLSVINNVLAGKLGEWGFWKSLISLFYPSESDRALKALARVGIEDKAHEKTAHLSGGEQQRVALARLLVQHPQTILADEPIASVDPARAEDLLTTLKSIAREENLTLIVSLHSVELALKYFPRIIAMRNGQIFYDRSSDSLNSDDLDQLYDLSDKSNREATLP